MFHVEHYKQRALLGSLITFHVEQIAREETKSSPGYVSRG
jgi:hypothetical protein